MKTYRLLPLALALFLFFLPQRAEAQFLLGPRGGFDLDIQDAFVGAEARFDLPNVALPITIAPSIDYFLVGSDLGTDVDVSQRLLTFDVNALYSFGFENRYFTPYAGAGLGIAYSSVEATGVSESNTDLGLNLIGGATFGAGNLRPYAQARIKTLGDDSLLSLMGGILFRLGG